MILYGSTMSPFVRKVAAYAAEKGIDIELQQTGFPNHTPEFCAASPFKKMPALADGDYLLSDSSAIIHYLEAKCPEPELIPADASVEMEAKKAAGYFAEKTGVKPQEDLKGIVGRTLDE